MQKTPPTALEDRLGARFRDPGLLRMAVTHSSYVNEHGEEAVSSNERLEFLGDAVLGFIVGARLYQDLPLMTEGELTAARAALVRGESLAEAAAEIELGDALLLGLGEETSGGRNKTRNLAGAFEALLAAVYLDQGYETARDLVLRLFHERLALISPGGVPQDPKSRLQESMQGLGRGTPTYRTVREEGPEHAKHFTAEVLLGDDVLGMGTGARKLEAERRAAQVALAGLDVEGQG